MFKIGTPSKEVKPKSQDEPVLAESTQLPELTPSLYLCSEIQEKLSQTSHVNIFLSRRENFKIYNWLLSCLPSCFCLTYNLAYSNYWGDGIRSWWGGVKKSKNVTLLEKIFFKSLFSPHF